MRLCELSPGIEAEYRKAQSQDKQSNREESPGKICPAAATFFRQGLCRCVTRLELFYRCGSRCRQIVGNRLLLVHTQMPGVGANEALIENASRKLLEVFLFYRAKETSADLCAQGNFVERDPTPFPFLLHSRAERSHLLLSVHWDHHARYSP